jgi:hypothetical protein
VSCVASAGAAGDVYFSPGAEATDKDNVRWLCGIGGTWSMAKEQPKPAPKPAPKPPKDDYVKIELSDVLISSFS